MSSDQKKVFLSYRRLKAAFLARAVFQHLTSEGYDVFMDVESLDSGEFPSLILRQIEARPHFIVALVPGSLERTVKEGDWLRREIEHAMRCERNIVPLLADGFSFDAEKRDLAVGKLPPKIEQLGHHNSVSVPVDYFTEAMDKLTTRFLRKEVRIAVTPTPDADLWTVERMLKNAALATPKPEGKWTWATKEPLTAPVLSDWNEILGCSWTAVVGATGYVLEKSADRSFIAGEIVYRGDRTSYFTPVMDAGVARSAKRKRSIVSPLEPAGRFTPATEYYRVKATGGFGFLDGPWSNVVGTSAGPWQPSKSLSLLGSLFPPLPAPVLTRSGTGWNWSSIQDAAGYVLEASNDGFRTGGRELYSGPATRWKPILSLMTFGPSLLSGTAPSRMPDSLLTRPAARKPSFRVKAIGGLGAADSPWSNVVESG